MWGTSFVTDLYSLTDYTKQPRLISEKDIPRFKEEVLTHFTKSKLQSLVDGKIEGGLLFELTFDKKKFLTFLDYSSSNNKFVFCAFDPNKKVGEGSQGKVLLGRNIDTNAPLVIKIPYGMTNSEDIKNEIKILKKINDLIGSPVYDAETCIIMKYYAGENLLFHFYEIDKSKEGTPGYYFKKRTLGPFGAAQLTVSGLNQLIDLRLLNIVHRDLKPENVLVLLLPLSGSMEYYTKFIDFGMACDLTYGRQKKIKKITCTPGYIPPEFAESGGLVDYPKGDIFMLGVMIAEAVTECNFRRKIAELWPNKAKNFQQFSHEEYVSLFSDVFNGSPNDPSLIKTLKLIASAFMAKDPLERPSTIEELTQIRFELASQIQKEKSEISGGFSLNPNNNQNSEIPLTMLGKIKERSVTVIKNSQEKANADRERATTIAPISHKNPLSASVPLTIGSNRSKPPTPSLDLFLKSTTAEQQKSVSLNNKPPEKKKESAPSIFISSARVAMMKGPLLATINSSPALTLEKEEEEKPQNTSFSLKKG